MNAANRAYSYIEIPIPKPLGSLSESMGYKRRDEMSSKARRKGFKDIAQDGDMAKEQFPPDYFLLVE